MNRICDCDKIFVTFMKKEKSVCYLCLHQNEKQYKECSI